MTDKVEWTQDALRDARRLDRQVRERVVAAVERFAETGEGDVKGLKAPLDGLRLRVGSWRVLFRHDRGAGVIRVLRVKHRSQAYRG